MANIVAAMLVPFVVEALLQVWIEWSRNPYRSVSWDFASFAISAAAGFVFLVREFHLRAIGIAIVYFPMIFMALLIFALWFNGVVYQNWL
jgi:hypothetical protein